jgi:ABC-type multidrug transport system ATPase subunit
VTTGLEVRGLGAKRGGRAVLSHVSFDAASREIVAVIGPNGAGKTTLFETLVGQHRAAAGHVRFADREVRSFRDAARVFAYMPDAAEPPAEVRVDSLFRPDHEHLWKRLGLGALANARGNALSRGEKRRVLLYSALCSDRPVLVLDEPLGVFDPLQLADVSRLLGDYAAKGAAILVSVHQLADAEAIASRFLLLTEGRSVAFGTLDDLRASAALPGASLKDVFLSLLARETHARA